MRFVEQYVPDSHRAAVDAFKRAVAHTCGDMGLALTAVTLRPDGDQPSIVFTLSDALSGRTATVACATTEPPDRVGRRVRYEAGRMLYRRSGPQRA